MFAFGGTQQYIELDGINCNGTSLQTLSAATIRIAASGTAAPDFGGYRPQYQGYGTTTVGGRGGTLYRVTNLNDSGAGSLRDALEASGARCIVFDTSGTIVLNSSITITNPFVTIAGQSAPSPGITLRGYGLSIFTHDVVIQHLRVRPGDGGPLRSPQGDVDGLQAYNFIAPVFNVVFDHVSVSWAAGKNLNILTGTNPANVLVWRSIIAEALYFPVNITSDPGHVGSLAMLIGGINVGVSIIGNLFAHNSDRNPEIHEDCTLHFVNNVVYDWGKESNGTQFYQWATFFYAPVPGPWLADVVGNLYIAGTPPHPYTPLYAIGTWDGASGSQVYLSDNAIDSALATVVPYVNYMGFDPRVVSPPVDLSGLTILPATAVKAHVVANAGARPLDRDSVDARVVDDVNNYTGTVISSQNTVGGWPTLAVNTQVFADPANPNVIASGQTVRTNREMTLETLALALEPAIAAGTAAHHIRVKNAELVGPASAPGLLRQVVLNDAPTAGAQGFNEFTNLTIHGGLNNDNENGLFLETSDNIIENCTIYDVPGAGILVYNTAGVLNPGRNTIRNNNLHDFRATAIGQRHWGVLLTGSDNALYNNVVDTVPSNGSDADGIQVLGDSSNALYNNTIFAAGRIGIALASAASSATIVRNNIAASCGINYQNAGVGTLESHNVFAIDPSFVDPSGGNFQLVVGSPAIDGGTPIALFDYDITGRLRPQGAAWDAGAYEALQGPQGAQPKRIPWPKSRRRFSHR